MTDDDPVRRLHAECAAVGFDLSTAGAALVERVRLLAKHSQTFDDSARMASFAHRVFEHYETSGRAFSPIEKQTVVLACLFSDIGKTGPADADAEARKLVVEIFAIENIKDDSQPIASTLRAYFPDDAEERLARFTSLGLDPEMSLRQFWNLHSHWTLVIVEDAGLPAEAVAAAATHHFLENVNPQKIVGDDDRFTRHFGKNTAFDRAEKLVIVLDKYDAAKRRGGKTHEGAIAWLRERIAKNDRYRDDPELAELVQAIEEVLK